MARPNEGWANLGPLKGTNSSDNPLSLGEGWAVASHNVTLDPMSALAVKRRGSSVFPGTPANTYLLAYHLNNGPAVPGEAHAQMWAFTENAGVYGASLTLALAGWSAVASQPSGVQVVRALSFNGKLFMACHTLATGINRMYVYDPDYGGVRLVGLGVSGAPTAANTGGGSYAATLRHYKVDWVRLHTVTLATAVRSELSPAVSFTPSGAGLAARVTRPATLEHATHWRVWGSADGVLYHKLSGNIPIATTTFDDTVVPTAYTGDFPEPIGTFLPPPAVVRIITDGNRLILGGMGLNAVVAPGTGETAPSTTRVWYTPVLGSLDQGDDERIPHTGDQKNWLDIGDAPIGDVMELEGPMEGQIYAFAKHRPWRLIPTGDLVTPYLVYPVTGAYGAGRRRTQQEDSAAIGETETGAPTIYFVDSVGGMFRTSGESVQLVSYDIQDEVNNLKARNDNAAYDFVYSWPEMKQTWWCISLQNPRELFIYVFHWPMGRVQNNVVVGGWTRWQMSEQNARMCSVIGYNRTPGTDTALANAHVPHLLQYKSSVYAFDRGLGKDGATHYSAYITAAPVLATGAQAQFRVGNPVIVCTALPGLNLRVSANRDFGTETRYADVSIAPVGSEVRVVRTVEGLFEGDVTAVEITVGDALPTEGLWQLDYLTFPSTHQQPR